MRAFRIVQQIFFYLLPFSRYKGPKRAKMQFLKPHQSFIFHPILMGFFSLNSYERDLSQLLQPIFSISYRFRDKRDPKGQKYDEMIHICQSVFVWINIYIDSGIFSFAFHVLFRVGFNLVRHRLFDFLWGWGMG